jgi:hypothetical protein
MFRPYLLFIVLCWIHFLQDKVESKALVMYLGNRNHFEKSDSNICMLNYCLDCHAPEHHGSFVLGLAARYGLKTFSITGELVYGIPNFGEAKEFINRDDCEDRIVFVNRGGGVPIRDKVVKAQKVGAIGVIVVDDGRCDEAFYFCGVQAGNRFEGGFAPNDRIEEWNEIRIPVFLVTARTGDELRNHMDVESYNIKGLGTHNSTVLSKEKRRREDDDL